MLFLGKKEIELVFINNKAVTQIYKGIKLVWEAVRSCFGAGYWKNDSQWSNSEGWKN